MVQLTDDLVENLDTEAARRRISRSAIIREAITEHLVRSSDDRIGRLIVEGYTRVPPGTPDEWGSPDDAGDISARELAQRLDQEERAAGLDPW